MMSKNQKPTSACLLPGGQPELIMEMTGELCHLARELSGVRVELTKAVECLRSHSTAATKCDLEQMEKRIMATQQEVAEELRIVKTQVSKIKQEVIDAKDELQVTIKKLEDLIAGGGAGNATPELVTIKDELKAELQGLDDLHLDKILPA